MRIIPARTQSQDKKFQTSRPCEARRSVQVTTFVVSSFFTLSLQAVVLLTKIAINHRFFSVKSGFKKSQRLWLKELLLCNHIEAIFENFHQKWKKSIMWSSIQVHSNQVSKKSFYTFEDIDLWESHAKAHKKPSETLGADSILRLKISIYCLPRNFNWFSLYFAQCSFTEMKTTFIKLQNEPLPKDIGQELLYSK